MNDKAFLVTTGEYSDYRVEGVFTTREKAEEFASHYHPGYNEAEIEEVILDVKIDQPRGMKYWYVSFDREGNSNVRDDIPPGRHKDHGYFPEDGCVPCGDGKMGTSCWAKDKAHAAKIANERRIQVVVNGGWETDWNKWNAARIARLSEETKDGERKSVDGGRAG